MADLTAITDQFPRLKTYSEPWDNQDALNTGLTTILDGLQTQLDRTSR